MPLAASLVLVLLLELALPRPSGAGVLCRWFGLCYYESPGFRIVVVDRESGRPLADVHALAEWVAYGAHGANGPLMVQEAVSGPDGILEFPPWGPIRGFKAGLVVGHDPFLSLFRAGYRVYQTNNRGGPLDETARVRPFAGDGQTYFLEPFRGTPQASAQELRVAAYPNRLGSTSREQLAEFRRPYRGRHERVLTELLTLPQDTKEVRDLVWSLERSLQLLREEGR
jgi:hypothetical protein